MHRLPPAWLIDAAEVVRPWMRDAVDGEAALPLTTLLSPDRLAEWLGAHRSEYGIDACSRGASSVWSKHLMSALLPAPMLMALAGVAPAADPVIVVGDGRPRAAAADVPGWAAASADAAGAARWAAGPLAETVAALAAASGLSPRVFWSNAAAMLAYLFEKWAALPEAAERSAALHAALFLAPYLAGSDTPNPLRDQISYVATPVPAYPTMRRRRICCLRDRVGQRLCASCPKITAEDRDRLLYAAARPATAPSTRPTG